MSRRYRYDDRYNRRRGYGRSSRGHGRRDHYYGRHQTSPLTRTLTTIALWGIVLVAIASGAIEITGK